MNLNMEFVLQTLQELMAIDSPSGYTSAVMEKVERIAEDLGYGFEMTHKGNGIITVPGLDPEYVVGFCAHVDTLGLMVRSITDKGSLRFTKIGGPVTAASTTAPSTAPSLPSMFSRNARTREPRKTWR